MKQYKQLPTPPDSAWNRFTFRKYAPVWLKNFIDGVTNIAIWMPTIYKDKSWDGHYIFEILKFKLIQQRKQLVKANRHTGCEIANRDITLCLNL
jgi:hypothetical protein